MERQVQSTELQLKGGTGESRSGTAEHCWKRMKVCRNVKPWEAQRRILDDSERVRSLASGC
jgi:hypothetical protein